ncbi:hypothetical protein GCM10022261_01850 [Brevibacterium daeguense]|uniref:DUF1468 domain-containing protein n=1 Tax=Brevibacterium daeguense TaxID=909936 RepID=A0ABP8EF99_9MICO|nr:tripartite tricarboxylate transporter TctB family protein [Brevibacterium daeguense]
MYDETRAENGSEASNATSKSRPAVADVVGTSVLGLVGLFAAVMGLRYGVTAEGGQVGPGFLPLVTGGFVVLASLAELVRMFFFETTTYEGSFMQVVEEVEEEAREAVAEAGEHNPELDTFGRTSGERRRAILLIFGILFAAVVLIPVIGLLLALTLMVMSILIFVERKSIVVALVVAAAAFAVIYVIFVLGLRVPVPTGMLGLV